MTTNIPDVQIHHAYVDHQNYESRNFVLHLVSSDPTPVEGKLIYRIDLDVVKWSDGTSWFTIGTGGGAVAASDVSILDTANDFTATDVEGALAELQSADEADEAALAAHLADTSDAHDASAISILDTANDFAATDVEGALAELQSDHEADAAALANLNATSVIFTPSGDISSTNVSAAILEALSDAKAYSDALAQGLKIRGSVLLVETTANKDLNGSETIDGTTTPNNAKVLLTVQTDADENGIWIVNTGGAWTRPANFDDAADVVEGAYVLVEEGTNWEGTGWTLSEITGTFGSFSAQTWTQFSGAGEITVTAPVTKVGNTLSFTAAATIGAGGPGGGLTNAGAVDKDVVTVHTSGLIGNGSLTTFDISHSSARVGVPVTVVKVSDGTKWEPGVSYPDVNTARIVFTGYVPSTNEFRVQVG